MLTDRDIVILASAPWRAATRVNCHHVAERLAAGNRVLFVESPGLRTPNPFHPADLLKVLRRLGGWLRGLAGRPPEPLPDLHVMSPLVAPFRGRALVRRLNARLLRRKCARAARRLGFDRPILWTFLPVGVDLVGALGESGVVYHCVDAYAGNPGVDAASVSEQERELAALADLCFATSAPLADHLRSLGADVRCVPNVAETARFSEAPAEVPADLAEVPRPLIGYVGNIASYKVDVELIAELARARPDWSLVLVGPVGVGDPATRAADLEGLPNVHLLGPRPPEDVPGYVHAFDVCLIPFRKGPVTDCSLPLKTFEYLAAGKPVVAAPLASLLAEPLAGVIRYADGPGEFAREIDAALAGSSDEARRLRSETASAYSWERRFPEIARAVAEAIPDKGGRSPR